MKMKNCFVDFVNKIDRPVNIRQVCYANLSMRFDFVKIYIAKRIPCMRIFR